MDYKDFVELVIKNSPQVFVIKASPFILKQICQRLENCNFLILRENLNDESSGDFLRDSLFGKSVCLSVYNARAKEKWSKNPGIPIVMVTDDTVEGAISIDEISTDTIVIALLSRAQQRGYSVTKEAVSLVLEYYDPSVAGIKLDEFSLKHPGTLTREIVSEILGESNSHIFSLFDAILKGMRPKVKSILDQLVQTQDPRLVLSTLITLTRRVLSAQAYLKDHKPYKDFCEFVGKGKENAARKAWSQAQIIPENALQILSTQLIQADIAIKIRHREGHQALLEHLLPSLI